MNTTKRNLLIMLAFVGLTTIANAQYVETINKNGLKKNLKEYGLIDDGAVKNQSDVFQSAIDDVASNGGGVITVSKGDYRIAGIKMKSNVLLQFEKNTVLKPFWPKGEKATMFSFDGDAGAIKNVGIQGLGGQFIVDYSERGSIAGEGIRVVNCKKVNNFVISDMYIKDSFTTYCAVIFTPDKNATINSKDIFRPTNGLVKNLKSTNSSPGYGLVQMHAGEQIHFEKLEAYGGGITFRLETGAGGHVAGVHDITAKDIYCENGATAVLLGPHTAQNGVVIIDGVKVKSCAYAVTMGAGFVENKNDGKGLKSGIFGEGTTVKNVHAIFGYDAAVSLKGIGLVPEEHYKYLKVDPNDRKNKRVRGCSIAVIREATGTSWNPIIENVSSEGFEIKNDIIKINGKQTRVSWKEVLTGYPVCEELMKNPPKIKKQSAKHKKS